MTTKEIMVAFEKQRKKKGISCEEIGVLTGVAKNTVYGYRSCKNLTVLDKLIDVLSVVGLELVVKEKGEDPN